MYFSVRKHAWPFKSAMQAKSVGNKRHVLLLEKKSMLRLGERTLFWLIQTKEFSFQCLKHLTLNLWKWIMALEPSRTLYPSR